MKKTQLDGKEIKYVQFGHDNYSNLAFARESAMLLQSVIWNFGVINSTSFQGYIIFPIQFMESRWTKFSVISVKDSSVASEPQGLARIDSIRCSMEISRVNLSIVIC
jgi:hypothetical protein